MTGLNRDPPHVLVISGETETDRDYEIEHPPECPLICDWSGSAFDDADSGIDLTGYA